ncbi:MAG: translation initiation factor IF-6 [Thermoplasmata archaeon]|nr:translation initiation factor IF-6 [Thermoplasmata archaeon]
MKFQMLAFGGNPFIGVYSRVSEDVGILPDTYADARETIEENLGVSAVICSVGESAIVGSMCAMNSTGVILPSIATPDEITFLKKLKNVCVINDKLNACGNNILLAERKALLNPEIGKKAEKQIQDVLGVETMRGTIAGIKTVGMCGVVGRKALIVHPKIKESEKKQLKDFFNLQIFEATANLGTPYIGACVLVNSKGALIGNRSTSIEIMKIQEALLAP